jgi:hypothetical protein
LTVRLAVAVAVVVLVLGAGLTVAGPTLEPLDRTCAPSLDEGACRRAVEAVRRRGLPEVHPLILAAHVEPGTAPDPTDLGHRATVHFDLLGVPGPTSVALYYDQGAHWGGVADRDAAELGAWTLAPLVVAGLLAVALLGLARRRRPARPR